MLKLHALLCAPQASCANSCMSVLVNSYMYALTRWFTSWLPYVYRAILQVTWSHCFCLALSYPQPDGSQLWYRKTSESLLNTSPYVKDSQNESGISPPPPLQKHFLLGWWESPSFRHSPPPCRAISCLICLGILTHSCERWKLCCW